MLFYGYGVNAQGKRVPASQLGTFDPDNPDTYGTGYVQYGPALKRVQQLGIPRGMAVEMLNQYYERGDQGRPLFNAAEQKAIKAKLNKTFGAVQGKRQWNIAISGINQALNKGLRRCRRPQDQQPARPAEVTSGSAGA